MSDVVSISDGRIGLALALHKSCSPEILAFGEGAQDLSWTGGRATRVNGMDLPLPSARLAKTNGLGDFDWPAITGHRDGRAFVANFADWRCDLGAASATLTAEDKDAELALTIKLDLANETLAMSTRLVNLGATLYQLDRCVAGSMIFPEGPATLQHLTGMWGREFQVRNEPAPSRLWLSESRRGRTSHDRNPSLRLTSATGSLAVHLGWSGNHLLAVDVLDDGRRLVHTGELFEPGEMRLEANQSYESPVAYFAARPDALRRRIRREIRWPGGTMKPRPVTLNTWEGNYFDHKLEALKAQASAASLLGIERFVLDDGWFGRRDNDQTSLGDWFVDARKYPQGLQELSDHVHALGMEFGLWFEPEMVNPESDLYRAHPDWALRLPLAAPLSRNQLVLDLTRADAFDHVFAQMSEIIGSAKVDCIKWDMNRDIAPSANREGRAATGRQTRAVYALMDRLREVHPHLEIESCASGGGRIDYGVLQRTHRFWASDCTDAFERLEIQRGARLFFPVEIIGAHVSASPNHQTNRRLSLDFRCLVALAFHMGVELNPLTLDDEEKATLAGWIALHKRLRHVLHDGEAFDQDPYDGRYLWGASCQDSLVVIVAQGPQMRAEQTPPLRLPPGSVGPGPWRVVDMNPTRPEFVRTSPEQEEWMKGRIALSATSLCVSGLNVPMLRPESGMIVEFRREGA